MENLLDSIIVKKNKKKTKFAVPFPDNDDETTTSRKMMDEPDSRINESLARSKQSDHSLVYKKATEVSFLSDDIVAVGEKSVLEKESRKPSLEGVEKILDSFDDVQELTKRILEYQPKGKFLDMEELKKSKNIKLRKFNDAVYYGEMFNEKMHGKGLIIYKDSSFYEGGFENNLKHGKGYEVTGSGCVYEGQYANNKPDGFGIFFWPNGEIYEGFWQGGVKHGSGMWKGIKGESYVGEWKKGKQDGYGVFIWRNGDRYEGEFKGFLKHGQGTEKFANGDYYVGNYNNGKPHGYGEYYWADGSYYKGAFQNGLRDGKGVWRSGSENYDEYDGDWINDKKSGNGVFKWSSGNRYEGEFFDDIWQGYGTMYWTDGSYYEGYWEKGVQHGEGQLNVPGERAKIGLFQNNVFIGANPENHQNESIDTSTIEKVKAKTPIRAALKKLNQIIPPLQIDPPTRKARPIKKIIEEEYIPVNQSMETKRLRKTSRKKKGDKHNQSWANNEDEIKKIYLNIPWRATSVPKKKKIVLEPIKRPPLLPSNSPRKPDKCLLDQREYIKWQHTKEKFLDPRISRYRDKDLKYPGVVEKIRQLISPSSLGSIWGVEGRSRQK